MIVVLFTNFGFEIARVAESIDLIQPLECFLLWIIILIPGYCRNLGYSVSSQGTEIARDIRLKSMMQLLVVIAEMILALSSVLS